MVRPGPSADAGPIVLFSLVLGSYQWAGGEDGITISFPTLFSWSFNSVQYPDRCTRTNGQRPRSA
jgi:hypothetical protein